MPQQTQQAQALAAAAQAASYGAQLRALQKNINDFLLTWNGQNYGNILANLPTLSFFGNGTAGNYDVTAGSGTVSVTSGSNALTFSTSQSGLAGTYVTITGDSTNGLYLVQSGSGTAWLLAAAYAGATNASASWSTSAPNTAHPIGVPTGNPLLMAEGNIVTMVGCLTNFQSYMTGVAITTQANTPQKFADLLNS
jgi:hypothetical protein